MQINHNVFKDRLRDAINNVSLKSWCENVGIPYSTLTSAFQRQTIPNVELLAQISLATGKSIDWLIGLSNDEKSVNTSLPGLRTDWDDFVRVPVYEVNASAGYGAFAPDEESIKKHLAFRRDFLDSLNLNVKSLYCVIVHGVSMEPALRNNHPALINADENSITSEGPYFIRLEGSLLVKNLQKLPGGRLRIWSENQTTNAFPSIEVEWPPREGVDLKIFGRVRWSDIVF